MNPTSISMHRGSCNGLHERPGIKESRLLSWSECTGDRNVAAPYRLPSGGFSYDGVNWMRQVRGAIALDPGLHPIRLEYYHGESGAGLDVSYQWPGKGETKIP